MPCQGQQNPKANAFCGKCERNFYSLSGKSKLCIGCRPAPDESDEKEEEDEEEHRGQGDEKEEEEVGEDAKYTWR